MKEKLEKLIEKYSTRLDVLNENLEKEGSDWNDDEYYLCLKQIRLTAEMSRDLKKLYKEYFVE